MVAGRARGSNTQCYRVEVGQDGELQFSVVEFSPRFADSVNDALMRLRSNGELEPALVRFHDWQELEQKWKEIQVS